MICFVDWLAIKESNKKINGDEDRLKYYMVNYIQGFKKFINEAADDIEPIFVLTVRVYDSLKNSIWAFLQENTDHLTIFIQRLFCERNLIPLIIDNLMLLIGFTKFVILFYPNFLSCCRKKLINHGKYAIIALMTKYLLSFDLQMRESFWF